MALDERMGFSVAWPIKPVEAGEELLIADDAGPALEKLLAASPAGGAAGGSEGAGGVGLNELAASPEFLEFQAKRELDALKAAAEARLREQRAERAEAALPLAEQKQPQ